MQEEIHAMASQVTKLFGYVAKFEVGNVSGTNDENGQLSAKRGYQEHALDNFGSASPGSKPVHGESRIYLGGRGPTNLPIDLGPSPWISG